MLVGNYITLEFISLLPCALEPFFEGKNKCLEEENEWIAQLNLLMFKSILKVEVRRPKLLLLLHQKLTLNPIELAWSEVKRYTKDNHKKFNFGHVKELTCNGGWSRWAEEISWSCTNKGGRLVLGTKWTPKTIFGWVYYKCYRIRLQWRWKQWKIGSYECLPWRIILYDVIL